MIFATGGTSPALLIELGAVLLVLAALARVALRFNFSPIPLYLLVGLAVGQGGLKAVEDASDFIEAGSQIGVVLLLFFLGLEYSVRELVTTMHRSRASGLVDLALNFPPGVAAGLLLGWHWKEALVLGGVTYISSSGIIAKLLDDLGRLGNRETPAVISVLVFEDLVMAVYLPIIASLLIGGTALAILGSVALSLVVVLIVLAAAWRFGPTLSRLVFSHSAEALLFGVLGSTLLIAGLAEQLEVSAAVGAFLMGIALSGPVAEAAHGTLEPVRDLFAAAFFLFFALEIDPADILAFAAPVAALAVLTAGTKIATGMWAARRIGVARAGQIRAGTSLVARGEFSIVIAGLAVSTTGQSRVGELAAGYVLVLAIAGPLLARSAQSIAARFGPPVSTPAVSPASN